MKDYFFSLANTGTGLVRGDEFLLLSYQGEISDFCRLNQSKIRQIGKVNHQRLEIRLEQQSRHASFELTLSGVLSEDEYRLKKVIHSLREILPFVPVDPYFIRGGEVSSSDAIQQSQIPSVEETSQSLLEAAKGTDLVGFLAQGGIFRGFANSLGQRNWFETHSFNFDWSLYLRDDKAVKSQYAGFEWDPQMLRQKMDDARLQLEYLARPAKVLSPGSYRAFLAPAAVEEIMSLLSWRGFGTKSQKTKGSPITRLVEASVQLHPSVFLEEDVKGGVAPNFDGYGFLKPERVPLIEQGKHVGSLTSARSSREYGVHATGASEGEQPESLAMKSGHLARQNILSVLGDGLYINNLWYMNFSDAPLCRMTGMTRFACFWVKNGRIENPLNVMRFDDSFFRMFGENLEGLTAEQELQLSSSTYEGRSTQSSKLPGALIKELKLTL